MQKLLKIVFIKTIFLTLLISNIPCITNAEINSDEKHLAQEIYYKEHPWDFVEQLFFSKVDASMSTKQKFLANLKIFAYDAVFLSAAICATIVADKFLQSRGHEVFFILIPIIPLIVFFHMIMYLNAYQKELYPNTFFTLLINLLNRYDPDLSKLDGCNTKNYIPKEFHSSFDALWAMYQKNGKEGLKNEYGPILYSLRDTLMYKIKPAKYARPMVHVTVLR